MKLSQIGDPLKVGFTGTRDGMTESQHERVRHLLGEHKERIVEVHHGDCIGSDQQFHNIATELGLRTVAHPPTVSRYRAFCDADEVHGCKDYLERNMDVVICSDWLLATPKERHEVVRSGTWATVRYARGEIPVTIIKPLEVEIE